MLKTFAIFIIALLGFGMIRLPLQNRILEQEKAAGWGWGWGSPWRRAWRPGWAPCSGSKVPWDSGRSLR